MGQLQSMSLGAVMLTRSLIELYYNSYNLFPDAKNGGGSGKLQLKINYAV